MTLKYIIPVLAFVTLLSCSSEQPDHKQNQTPASQTENNTAQNPQTADQEKSKGSKEQSVLPVYPIEAKMAKGKIMPFDEGQTDPGFNTFRENLYFAADRKDIIYLKSVLAADGESDLIAQYDLKNDRKSRFWSELMTCLKMGGGFETTDGKRTFVAPYYFKADAISSGTNPNDVGVVLGKDVRLRAVPSARGKLVGSASFDKYTVISDADGHKSETLGGETHNWVHIKTENGLEGYIYGKYAGSADGLRVVFSETSAGNWKLTQFNGGD